MQKKSSKRNCKKKLTGSPGKKDNFFFYSFFFTPMRFLVKSMETHQKRNKG